nr:CAZy families GH5 protein [uncultured Clostridium sp.]
MNNQPLRGVNLGGWLIHEKWMTPKVFKGTNAIDEYTLSQTEEGRRAIQDHRKNFIQEADFKWLKQHGIEILRSPSWVLAV